MIEILYLAFFMEKGFMLASANVFLPAPTSPRQRQRPVGTPLVPITSLFAEVLQQDRQQQQIRKQRKDDRQSRKQACIQRASKVRCQ